MFQAMTNENLADSACLVVQTSPINGRGLFTTKAIQANEVLLIISGNVIDAWEARRREVEEDHRSLYCLNDDRFLDPPPGHPARFINHACEPNAIPETRDEWSLCVRALRAIAPGEEITIDYDFEEIYDVCRHHNLQCRQYDCPRGRVSAGTSSAAR